MFGRPMIPNEQLAKVFGTGTAFSADAAITVNEASGKVMQMQMSFAMLDGKVRTEIDMTKMGGALPPDAMAHMKQMGMDRTVTIFLPTQNVIYMVYPGQKAYCEMTPPIRPPPRPPGKSPRLKEPLWGKRRSMAMTVQKSKSPVPMRMAENLNG